MSVPWQELYFNALRPLPEDRDPTCINWRWIPGQASTWVRQDGITLTRSVVGWVIDSGDGETDELRISTVGSSNNEAAMTYIDRVQPCPPPPPMAGQVWANYGAGGGDEMMVTLVRRDADNRIYVAFGGNPYEFFWPPIGYILVAGPGAPWQNTSPGYVASPEKA